MRKEPGNLGNGRMSVVADWFAVGFVLATILSVTLAIAAVG